MSNQNNSQIKLIPIDQELKSSYLDYSLSVIIQRALPDLRDGLKPVQRRILYSMYKLKLLSTAKFRKSATVVGDCIGKYHPHGDMPVYDALVRMAQDFSLRYPLVEGQGNMGSVDGDPPAAMRYTETKLSKIGEFLLKDIEKNTVDFWDNFDSTKKEPATLPSPIPQLLINGVSGIAVGMATNIPPHNLNEVSGALIYLIKNEGASMQDLLNFIKGPDFPTGGVVISKKSLVNVYSEGRGQIVTRAKLKLEEVNGQTAIVVSQIPYQVNKSLLLQRIAELVKDRKIKGIKEVRDESNKEGIRIVIELKRGTKAELLINNLYRLTDLEKPYHLNFLALVDGIEPRLLNLKEYLSEFLTYRRLVVKRSVEFDVSETKKRVEILEGFQKAISKVEEVIALIKKSESKEEAKIKLIRLLELNQAQAEAILNMRLSSLARLEREKIFLELREKTELIKKLTKVLKDPKEIDRLIIQELEESGKKFGDERKTEITQIERKEEETYEFIGEDEQNLIVLSSGSRIKRIPIKVFKTQKRGGTGLSLGTEEGEAIHKIIEAMTSQKLYLFSSFGRLYTIGAWEIQESERIAKTKSIRAFINLDEHEEIVEILPMPKTAEEDLSIILVTKDGKIKKTSFKSYQAIKKTGKKIINLVKGDELIGAKLAKKDSQVLVVADNGQGVNFKLENLRVMGANASGVKAIRLKEKSKVATFSIINKDQREAKILISSLLGFGKLLELKRIKVQGRAGSGIRVFKTREKTGGVSSSLVLQRDYSLLLVSRAGKIIKIESKEIPTLSRFASGVRLMRLEKGDSLVSIIKEQ